MMEICIGGILDAMVKDTQFIELGTGGLLGLNILFPQKQLVLRILGTLRKLKFILMRKTICMQCGWESITCLTTHTPEMRETLGRIR